MYREDGEAGKRSVDGLYETSFELWSVSQESIGL